MKRSPTVSGEKVIRPSIVVPELGPTVGDASLCEQYGIPAVSLDPYLSGAAASQEATALALACMPDQQFMVWNAGGILRRAIGVPRNSWTSGRRTLVQSKILRFHKESATQTNSIGLSLSVSNLIQDPTRAFYTPRVADTLRALQAQDALDSTLIIPRPRPTKYRGKPKKVQRDAAPQLLTDPEQAPLRPLAITAKRLGGGAAVLTLEPPADLREKGRLDEAGVVSRRRWLNLGDDKAQDLSAIALPPGELGDQPEQATHSISRLIATVLAENRGAITINGEPYDPTKQRSWMYTAYAA